MKEFDIYDESIYGNGYVVDELYKNPIISQQDFIQSLHSSVISKIVKKLKADLDLINQYTHNKSPEYVKGYEQALRDLIKRLQYSILELI